MQRLLISSGFAVSMIIIALGIAQGTIEAEFGQSMLIILPAFAVTMIRTGKCAPFLKAKCQ